ncbi:hypothetical protein HDU91_005444 [Kappamyces sp. JEL0680]|nr:hypothetical protein HDU91_005444 [Kappamyces sp. JEL0680]
MSNQDGKTAATPSVNEVKATFKILLIGDSGTGKSSILLRFTDDLWLQPDQVSATIGVDFKVKTLLCDGRKYKLTIWVRATPTLCGYWSPRQPLILGHCRTGAVQNADIVILSGSTRRHSRYDPRSHAVYDVTNRSTFTHLETWFEELATYSSEGVVKIIVGNKNDKHGREVSRKEGEALAAKVGGCR